MLRIILNLLFAVTLASVGPMTQADPPDILTLPWLRPGLPAGTLALALPGMLHPTQAQTGHVEVKRKTRTFEDMLPRDPEHFPKDLYEYFVNHPVISPVYLGPTLKSDTRHGREEVLGYITDRTHGAFAQSQLILDTWGKEALRKPRFDDKGRPLNFIVVRVMGDKSGLSEDQFVDFMVREKHCFLKVFTRQADGSTKIHDISFRDLPESPLDTTDNPFRGAIGEAQHEDLIPRVSEDFSQFIMAANLVTNDVVTWDEVVDHPKRSSRKIAVFFKDHPEALKKPITCATALSKDKEPKK